MSFFAILLALLLEQARPIAVDNPIHRGMLQWVRALVRSFDTGQPLAAWGVWAAVVLLPALVAALLHHTLLGLDSLIAWPLVFMLHVALLYLCLGFRQFSMHFSAIRSALDEGNEPLARQQLASWQQLASGDVPATMHTTQFLRHVLEQSALSAHRHVFGVLVCYGIGVALGCGPAGAPAYRCAQLLARYCARAAVKIRSNPAQATPVSAAMQVAAHTGWYVLDWLPARVTALLFAMAGHFEEAVDCWRNYANALAASQQRASDNDGIVLAATAGALQVRLGGPPLHPRAPDASSTQETVHIPPSTPGNEPQTQHLRSIVGLVWRAVVVWMVLQALMGIAQLAS